MVTPSVKRFGINLGWADFYDSGQALVLFSYKPGTITVSEAAVPVTSGTTFRMYVESPGSGKI